MATKRGPAACLLAAALFLLNGAALAAPVDEADRAPLDLRRTTLVVGDIERSRAFQRAASVHDEDRARDPVRGR